MFTRATGDAWRGLCSLLLCPPFWKSIEFFIKYEIIKFDYLLSYLVSNSANFTHTCIFLYSQFLLIHKWKISFFSKHIQKLSTDCICPYPFLLKLQMPSPRWWNNTQSFSIIWEEWIGWSNPIKSQQNTRSPKIQMRTRSRYPENAFAYLMNIGFGRSMDRDVRSQRHSECVIVINIACFPFWPGNEMYDVRFHKLSPIGFLKLNQNHQRLAVRQLNNFPIKFLKIQFWNILSKTCSLSWHPTIAATERVWMTPFGNFNFSK